MSIFETPILAPNFTRFKTAGILVIPLFGDTTIIHSSTWHHQPFVSGALTINGSSIFIHQSSLTASGLVTFIGTVGLGGRRTWGFLRTPKVTRGRMGVFWEVSEGDQKNIQRRIWDLLSFSDMWFLCVTESQTSVRPTAVYRPSLLKQYQPASWRSNLRWNMAHLVRWCSMIYIDLPNLMVIFHSF